VTEITSVYASFQHQTIKVMETASYRLFPIQLFISLA